MVVLLLSLQVAVGPSADKLVDLARLGWEEARRLAPLGGAPDLLGNVHGVLAQLETLKTGEDPLDIEYAQTVIRAAIAAAQDERLELELLLSHARDLAQRLSSRGRRATIPHSFNLVAGELWLEVDRYEEARMAYERAVRAEATAPALIGLARSLAKLEKRDEACEMYRRARGLDAVAADRVRAELSFCN